VVTAEMVITLREQREKSDALKASRKAKKLEKAFDTITNTTRQSHIMLKPPTKKKKKVQIASPTTTPSAVPAEHNGDSDWEEEEGGGQFGVDNGSGSEGSEYMEAICTISSQLGQLEVGGNVSGEAGGNLAQNSAVNSQVRRSGRILRAQK